MEIHEILTLYGLNIGTDEEEIEDYFVPQRYKHDEVIFREGDKTDKFYIIKSGKALASRKSPSGQEEHLDILKEGDCFGEIGLIQNIERTATMKAIGSLECYYLDRDVFARLVQESAPFARLLKSISIHRLIKHVEIFKGLDDASLTEIQNLMLERQYKEKEFIFKQNDSPDAFYIIMYGSVRIFRKATYGKEISLALLSRGDFFGEQGLIELEARSAFVIANEPTTLLLMRVDDFHQLLKTNAKISFNILRVMSHRMRETNREMAIAKSTSFFKGMTIIARPNRCMSCRSCEIACAVAKSRSQTLYGAINEDPLPVKRIRVRKVVSGSGSEPIIRPEHCLHCHDAPCLAICKFKAVKRDIFSRTIVIDADKCVGCGLCAKACTFNVISMVRNEGKRKVALKCTYCSEHQEGPACVRSCPTHTLVIALAAQKDF